MMDPNFSSMGFSARSSLDALQKHDGLLQVADGADVCVDTILRLDSLGSSVPQFPISKGIKRKWLCIDGFTGNQSKGSSTAACTEITFAKGIEEESSVDLDLEFSLQLVSEKSPTSKKVIAPTVEPPSTKVDLELSLCSWPCESDVTSVHDGTHVGQSDIENPLGAKGIQFDESSSLSLGNTNSFLASKPVNLRIDSFSIAPGISASTTTTPKGSVTCTSGLIHPQRVTSSKLCKFTGCSKGARGASGLCISHGGGRRCQRPGCDKGAEGKTAFCKSHGGGKRCQFLGCTKSAEGHTEFCIAHGGGRRCSHEGCTKAARGKSGLCIRHGGGKRCQRENCTRSAEGQSGLCISHGGGRRCQYPTCTKGAQGSTMFCKAHGGGKRCTVEGCTKGAEGSTPFCKGHGGGKRCSFVDCPKSVHGGTAFCVAHGGGKRCVMHGCTKSARGRTDFCVRHGGGKRCKFESCGKSAQGSTDFCKAHGGGKKCSCGSFARGKVIHCSVHGALVQDKRIHGGITLGPLLQAPSIEDIQIMNTDLVRSDCGDATTDELSVFETNQNHSPFAGKSSSSSPVPEGRVHGGSLLAMLTGSSS